MLTGIVKKLKLENGYGFLEIQGGPDLFFHCSTLQAPLEFNEQLVGQRVEVESEVDRRSGKLRASAVWPASN